MEGGCRGRQHLPSHVSSEKGGEAGSFEWWWRAAASEDGSSNDARVTVPGISWLGFEPLRRSRRVVSYSVAWNIVYVISLPSP